MCFCWFSFIVFCCIFCISPVFLLCYIFSTKHKEISNIKLDNAELFVLGDDNWIFAKYYMESENPDTNFLVYAPFRKPSDEDNFLADMTHYATLFSADKINILCQELNIDCSRFKEVLSTYSKFWNASSRINAFKDLNCFLELINAQSKIKENKIFIFIKICVKYFISFLSITDSL